MKKYFYSNEQGEQGPVTLEELKQKDITLKTLIWHEGLDDWKEAESIDELKEIFELGPRQIDTKDETLAKKGKKFNLNKNVGLQNNKQVAKEKTNDLTTPADSNENKSTSTITSKKYLWLILIPIILIISFGIGYGIGFFGEDDQYNQDEVVETLTPTLVESEDSNKVFNAVPDVNIYSSNIYVKAKKAYFYSHPNKESRQSSYLVMGDYIQYDPQSLVNGFYNSKFIDANNKLTSSGWIHQDAIFPDQKILIDGSSLTGKPPKKDVVASINVDKLNFRSSPEISDNIIGMLMLDNKVVFIDSISIDLPSIKNGTLNKNITIKHNGKVYVFNKNKVVKINGPEENGQLAVNIDLGDGRKLSNVVLSRSDLKLDKKQVWAKIEQGNKTGYVYYRFLNFDGPESANNFDHSASVTYIKINDPDGYTNVRAGKSSSTEIIYQIYDENKLFELLDDSGNWWKIKLDSSETKTSIGFIYKSKVIRVSNSQSDQTNTLQTNKKMIPQPIDYNGKPDLEYTLNNVIIALDAYSENDNEGSYIRMKFNNKEVILKKKNSSKIKRVYSNSEYVVKFDEIIYGDCAGEGAQNLTGKLLIQTKSKKNTVVFNGFDRLYSSIKCQGQRQ